MLSTKTSEKTNIIFGFIVLAFFAYAAVFIYRTSFIVEGKRYFSLFDDMMISMRYAKNLAQGYGLVWNQGGERVEGYTNLLWVVYMSFFHLFPLPPYIISLFIQISGAIFLALNLYCVRKVALLISEKSELVALSAVFLTAFYLPINNWGLQGTEVSLLILITSISIWQALLCLERKEFSLTLYVLLGLSTLVRLDMAVPFLSIELFLAFAEAKNRKKHLIYGTMLLLFFLLGQTLFRYWYYGDFLPNTYYLKLTGYPVFYRITRGLFVYILFVWNMNPILFFMPFCLFFFQRRKSLLFLLFIFLGQTAYSIYVGGDAWEEWGGSNRYISLAMPGFFILFAYSLVQVSVKLLFQMNNSSLSLEKVKSKYFPFLLLFCLLNFNCLNGLLTLKDFSLLWPLSFVQYNQSVVARAILLKKITQPSAKIAVTWAGALPYFSERPAIDLLGKNDKVIARGKMRRVSKLARNKFIAFYPGHLKFNYGYSIGQLKPDVVVHIWDSPQEAKPYLDKDYQEVKFPADISLYIRKDSPYVSY